MATEDGEGGTLEGIENGKGRGTVLERTAMQTMRGVEVDMVLWCCRGELGRGVVGIRFGRCRVHECGQGFTCLDSGPHYPFPTTPSPHAHVHAQLPRDDFDSVSTNHYTFYDTTTYFKKQF